MSELPPTRFVKHLRGASVHRKFQRLGRALGISRFEAYGVTGALWDWVDEHRPDGDLDRLDAEAITDSIAASDRFDPVELVAAWLEVGLLDRDETGRLRVHGWTDEGRSGSDHEVRSEKARNAAHILWHVKKKNPKPDTCRLCRSMPEGASPQMPEGASSMEDRQRTRRPTTGLVDARGGMPEGASLRMPEASRSGMPDEDKDKDEDDQKSPKEKKQARTRENESAPARVYAPDDPERPFVRDEIITDEHRNAEIARLHEVHRGS
jgi:hypothetical protein